MRGSIDHSRRNRVCDALALVKECGAWRTQIQEHGKRALSSRHYAFFICCILRAAPIGRLIEDMARADHHPSSGIPVVAIVIGCALVFAALVLAVRQVRIDTPASPHAQSLLKLDSALGATVEPLDARAARVLGGGSRVDEMVVTSVAAGGRASAAGLRVGDVVEQVDGEDAANLDAAIDAVSTDPTQIVVNRHGTHVMLKVPAPAASRV